MKIQDLKLSQVAVNKNNPRRITEEKFQRLINSILSFPKMLRLRPVVVNEAMVALGGNMRYRALSVISEMQPDELKDRLSGLRDFQKMTQGEQETLLAYWDKWQDNPTAPCVNANDLTEYEKRKFIAVDNVSFGDWDKEMLAEQWDEEDLDDWGVTDWRDDEDGGSSDGSGSGSDLAKPQAQSLNDTFIIPPFSILDCRQGYWQKRKKMWRERIGDMGASRQGKLVQSVELQYKDLYTRTSEHRKSLGISFKEYLEKYVPDEVKEKESKKVLSQGVSLFDPVLAEILCK